MLNFDDVVKENIKEHNPNWSQIPVNLCRILIIAGSRSGKANPVFNLINQQTDIDKMYLYVKDPYEANIIFLINKRKSTDLTIRKLLLNTRMIQIIFIKTLKITTQIKAIKH